MDVKQLCEKKINKMVGEVTTQERMEEYLSMLSRFPQMGMENILLLLSQLPDATVVCGKGAWVQYGATIKEGKKPIALLGLVKSVAEYEDEDVDEDEDELVVDFGPVAVYDISQVNISEKTPQFSTKNELKKPIEEHLREKYHISIIEDTSGDNIKNKIFKSLYRANERTVYLRSNLTKIQIEEELVKIYTKIALADRNIPDFTPEMEHYTTIALCKHFNLPCGDKNIRPTELFVATNEEKRVFLRSLTDNFFSIVCELSEKEILSFNETALCNILFSSPNKDDVYASIGGVTEMAGTTDIRDITRAFMNRVLSFDEEIYAEIKKRRDMQVLFTFPPTELKNLSK